MASSFTRTVGRSLVAVIAAGSLLAGGCGESEQAAATAAQAPAPAMQKLPTNRPEGADPVIPQTPVQQPSAGSQRPAAVAPAQPVATAAPALPNIPPDAQWTIFCFTVTGPDHVRGANVMKESLVQKTGRPDWYLIHGRDESNLYFGFYKAVQPGDQKNATEVSRAQNDLREIKDLRDAVQNKPFEHSSAFVSLEAPDPTAPPEWNLYNVDKSLHPKDPRRAYWSLQIMAFRANPKRKEAAVEAVRDLRAHGVEAYYFHGESISSVCVGHWPADALKAQNRTADRPDVAHSDPSSDLFVSTIDPGDDAKPRMINGRPVVAAIAKQEILDPSLNAMIKKFPHHAVNYEEGRKLPSGKEVYQSSFLVEIPRAKGNGAFDYVDPNAPMTVQQRGIGDPNGPSMTGSSTGMLRPGNNGSLQGVR